MKHIGNLIITTVNKAGYAELTEVTGYLSIQAEASLPVLTTVGDYLCIRAEASLPMLTTVGGSLGIYAEASLPVLTTVGGSLYIQAEASFPVLTTVHSVPGNLIAVSEYGLWAGSNGLYYAGCREELTREQALRHWDREDDRACLYTLAIGVTS